MKMLLRSGMILLIVLGFLGNLYAAQSLQSEYKEMERSRKKLEKQRKYYEQQLNTLNIEAQDLRRQIAGCEDRLKKIGQAADKLETQRAAIGKMRTELDKKRLGIEQARIGIEKKYSDKSHGSEYEEEFRKYMDDVHNEYMIPVETQLLRHYEQYLSGFENYILMLRTAVQSCKGSKGN